MVVLALKRLPAITAVETFSFPIRQIRESLRRCSRASDHAAAPAGGTAASLHLLPLV